MPKFNTAYLLEVTGVVALCCMPMGLNRETGFVWTAFLLPISLAVLIAVRSKPRGDFKLELVEISAQEFELRAAGGTFELWSWRARMVLAGYFLSHVTGFPMLHRIDPEPMVIWLPLVLVAGVIAVVVVGTTVQRVVSVEERGLVTNYSLFGRLLLWRNRWRVQEGDSLAVLTTRRPQWSGATEAQFWEALYVCRGRRRHYVVGLSTRDRVCPTLDIAARQLGELLAVPYAGYGDHAEG